MSASAPQVVYVTSRGHSGSTLTEMLIGAHSRVVALGELRQLGTDREEPCRCGGGPLPACWFWSAVEERVQHALGVPLAALSLEDDDDAIFVSHNRALVQACIDVAGVRIAVDASKTLQRLKRLVELDVFDLQVLHLTRSPYGVVYSNVKRGRAWLDHAQNYTFAAMRTREFLAELPEGVGLHELRYERLARAPERELTRTMIAIGLDFEPGQLDWATHEFHTFAGNPMRVTRDSTIRPDTAWRRGLGLRRIAGVAWWTLPTLFSGTHFFDEHRPYWKGEGVEAWRRFREKKREIRRRDRRRRWRQKPWLKKPYDVAKSAWRHAVGR